jgi:hypothetical protein
MFKFCMSVQIIRRQNHSNQLVSWLKCLNVSKRGPDAEIHTVHEDRESERWGMFALYFGALDLESGDQKRTFSFRSRGHG